MSELYAKRESKEWGDKMEPATPFEIAAAHPKCETCGHFDRARSADGFPLEWGYCGDGLPTDGYQLYTEEPAVLMPRVTDYCPHHTALTNTGAHDETH